MSGSAAAVSISQTPQQTTIAPGTNATAASYTVSVQNESVHVTDVLVNQFPFETTVTPNNISLTAECQQNLTSGTAPCPVQTATFNASVQVPQGFRPGTYTGELAFLFDNRSTQRVPISVTVPPVRNFTVQNVTVADNVSVESNPQLARFTVENTGNVNTTITFNASGNLSDYLSYPPSITVFPGLTADVTVSAGIPRDTPFGTYTGTLNLTGDAQTQAVNLSTRFVDTIPPAVQQTTVPSFQATKPDEFVVSARDNLDVARVNATILYETAVQVNNSTRTVNTTLDTLEFSQRENTDLWAVTPPAERRGQYYLRGEVADASGNRDTFTATYEVTGLNVTEFATNVSMAKRYKDKRATVTIGEITKPTTITIRLAHFDQPLGESGNETWKVGVVTPSSGERRLTAENETVTIDEAGTLRVYVESDTAESYFGRLAFEGVQQHVPIHDFTFTGAFSDRVVPQRQTFDVYNTSHECEPETSDKIAAAGWTCEYFVAVTAVAPGSSLENELQAVTPKNAEQQEEMWQTQIQGKHTQFMAAVGVIVVLATVIFLLLYAVYYVAFIAPYRYSIPLEDTQD